MTNHFTPKEARQLLDGTTPGPWAAIQDPPYVSIVQADDVFEGAPPIVDIPDDAEDGPKPDHVLLAAAPDLARMIAGARTEYAVARDDDYGMPEYFTDWRGWTEFKHAAGWSTRREPLEWVAKREGGHIITRLVIDLEEEL